MGSQSPWQRVRKGLGPNTRPKEGGEDLTEGGRGTSGDHAPFFLRAVGPAAQNPYDGEHEENRPPGQRLLTCHITLEKSFALVGPQFSF